MRAVDAQGFSEFQREILQRVFGDAGDVHLDVQHPGNANLAQDLARVLVHLRILARTWLPAAQTGQLGLTPNISFPAIL